jgi:hypothetical protein
LDYASTYFWRVDEVYGDKVNTGYLWRFTTKVNTAIPLHTSPLANIYPNPITRGQKLTIDLRADVMGWESVSLWDIKGEMIMTTLIGANKTVSLNIDKSFTAGIYFVRAETEKMINTPQKLVIL